MGVGLLQGSAAKLECRTPCRLQVTRDELAARRAAKIRIAAERKERMEAAQQAAKEAIAVAMVAVGASDTCGLEVVGFIEKRGALLKVWDGTEINAVLLEEFTQLAKCESFRQKLLTFMPSWHLTDLQKTAIVDKVLQMHSFEQMSNLVKTGIDHHSAIWREALESANRTSEDFKCQICSDPLVHIGQNGFPDISNMWYAPLRKNEHWSNQPCGHAFCRTCMGSWAETAINDQKVRVKCPAEGCSYSLWDQDLKTLVSSAVFERHQEHKHADYLEHLKSELKGDIRLNRWLKGHARPCPDCHVIVSRSEGCNDMQCVCGCNFCYACGFKNCQCGKSKKRDIWKPKASLKHD